MTGRFIFPQRRWYMASRAREGAQSRAERQAGAYEGNGGSATLLPPRGRRLSI